MVGHRMPECIELIGRIKPKLKQVFMTDQTVLISASSGTGLWEGAVRNCTDRRVLNCVNGAFADRWREVTEANGKANDVLDVPWGQPIRPEQVAAHLDDDEYDAITIVHNETSVGVLSPLAEIAAAVREAPNGQDIMILVDAVSGLAGARLEFDAWDLDVALASSQKAFALPAGLAFCAVSDRAMAKAATVANRGYYFDFITLARYMAKDQTPATPAVSLLFALDKQLDDMLAEGLDARFARHLAMRDRTLEWAKEMGLSLYGDPAFASPTVTNLANDGGLDIGKLNKRLRERGMIISNGYGPLKGKAFRIAHMGDIQPSDLELLLDAMSEEMPGTIGLP